MSREQQIIQEAGGEYLGVESGMIWFNEPGTGTTMTVGLAALKQDDIAAVEFIKQLMGTKRCAFALKRARR